MIKLIQHNGSRVTPTDDAALYNFFANSASGFVTPIQAVHMGGAQIKITSARGIACGRSFEIAEETVNANLSPSGASKGRISVKIDLSNPTLPGKLETVVGNPLPPPVQEDINGSGSVFEVPIAEYDIDTTQVSNLQVVAKQLKMPPKNKIQFGSYAGTDEVERVIELGYKPDFILIFANEEGLQIFQPGASQNVIYTAFGTKFGCSIGLELRENGFYVININNNAMDGRRCRLNAIGNTYIYMAVKLAEE